MAEIEQAPTPEVRHTAPDSGIFLDPLFKVDTSLQSQIENRDDMLSDGEQARRQLDAFDSYCTEEELTIALDKLRSGMPSTAHIMGIVATRSRLQETIDAPGIFRARVAMEAQRLADVILARFEPGRLKIGETSYELARGAWDRNWLFTRNEETGETVVFGRYDEIKAEEKLRGAGIDDWLRLVLNVSGERSRAVDQFGEPETVPEITTLLVAREGSGNEHKYPYISNKIHHESLVFFNEHEDLLANGMGNVVSFVDDSSGETVTIGFDARGYIADQDLRLDDKHRYFDGPGRFKWLVSRSTEEGVVVSGIETQGALIHALPVHRFDNDGTLRGVLQLDEAGIEELWETVRAGVTSEALSDYVHELRTDRSNVTLLPPTEGARPPKKAYRANGFKGPLAEHAVTA